MKQILCFFVLVCSFAGASEKPLEQLITLQAKNMKAEVVLRKLAEATKFNLVLNDDFPGAEKVTVDAKNFPLSRMLDLVAESTHTRWSADNSNSALLIRFEKKP